MLESDYPRTTSLRRTTFLASSLATTAVVTGSATEAAPTPSLGQPHAPFVAETAQTIEASEARIHSGDRTLEAYVARPKSTDLRGGVVVVQAIWGIDAQLRDVVRRFAAEGYLAVAPNLYTGIGPASADGQSDIDTYKTFAAKLVDATVDADLASAAAYARTQSQRPNLKIGVIGFCMGGAIALRQTVDTPTFAAASVFYGKVRYGTTGNEGSITPIALAYADEMRVPTVGSWGEKDPSILAADVNALDAKLSSLGKPHDVHVYPEAGHAFFDDTRSSYVASAADDAWKRTLAWFAAHLA